MICRKLVSHESLHKLSKFQLISGCDDFTETHVSPELRADCSKLCKNCVFTQNFQTRKLNEITVFYEMNVGDGVFVMHLEYIYAIDDVSDTND